MKIGSRGSIASSKVFISSNAQYVTLKYVQTKSENEISLSVTKVKLQSPPEY